MGKFGDLARDIEKKPTRGKRRKPLVEVNAVHRLFVTALLAQRELDPGEAWQTVCPGRIDPSVATEEGTWLMDQGPIKQEIADQLAPLFVDDDFDRAWVALQLYQISQANLFDYIKFEMVDELVVDGRGRVQIDKSTLEPIYRPVERVVLTGFNELPLWKQQNLKKLKIRRTPEGDKIELEVHDRPKAVNDIAKYSGIEGGAADGNSTGGATFAEKLRQAAVRQEKLARDRIDRGKAIEHQG